MGKAGGKAAKINESGHMGRFGLFLVTLTLLAFVAAGCGGPSRTVKPTDPTVKETKRYKGSKLGKEILKKAESLIGIKYKFGGKSPRRGFDCSGFAYYTYNQFGISIPRVSWEQYKVGKKIKRKDLQVGDLVFFTTYKKGPSHVGIYDGNGGFVHAPGTGKRVKHDKLKNSYYKKRYLGARRPR